MPQFLLKSTAFENGGRIPSGMQQYIFTFYGVDVLLGLRVRATRDDVVRAMQGHILGQARLTGKYARGRETMA